MKGYKKQILLIFILIIGLFVFTACGSNDSGSTQNEGTDIAGSDQSEEPESVVNLESSQNDISGEETLSTEEGAEANITGGSSSQPSESSQTEAAQNNASVIVKSDNIVTDAEKQKVLTELNEEIDSLVESLNQLEDATESDLEF